MIQLVELRAFSSHGHAANLEKYVDSQFNIICLPVQVLYCIQHNHPLALIC